MRNEEDVESRVVCCCTARSWSLVIGWLQTIFSGITILVHLGIVISMATSKTYEDGALPIVLLAVILISFSIELAAGILLILGVNQQSIQKIKIWYVIQVAILALTFLAVVLCILGGGLKEMGHEILVILITVFCLWVVNIHRRELIDATPIGFKA